MTYKPSLIRCQARRLTPYPSTITVPPVSPRFPFPSLPRGWFVVGFSSDVAPLEVNTVHYFGQDIVLFRSEDGVLSALDKTCPHVGAHLGGGTVEGNCLRCPFHAWAFNGEGHCVDVPYSPKIPPKAAVRAWPVREQNGVIFIYYCPLGDPPAWEVPLLDEEGWTPSRTVRWEVRSHPQEIAENTVDTAHLKPVHHTISCDVVTHEQKDHFMRILLHLVATGAPIQMPEEINDVELDVTLHGLGILISCTHVITAGLRTRQRIYPTPVDHERVAIFAINNVMEMPDPGYTREIDDIFWTAFLVDFPRDFPIWESKAYLERPLLAAGDGPIGRYRKWARQFYQAPQAAPEPVAAPEGKNAIDRVSEWVRALAKDPSGVLSRAARRHMPMVGGSKGAPNAQNDDEPSLGKAGGHQRPSSSASTSAAKTAPRFESVGVYFESLEKRFDRGAAGDLNAVFQWVLTGDQARSHFVEINAGSARASDGKHPEPTVTIEMTAEDYLLMINGELNGARAFSTGRGKLRGPVRLAMKMQKLFPLERAI
jgi:nitrite reductase/ring-hydroxylating ferredoxin subunit/putative sterol carrier protein